jgi:dienelactone hydrolase
MKGRSSHTPRLMLTRVMASTVVSTTLLLSTAQAAAQCPRALNLEKQQLRAFAAKQALIEEHIPEAIFSAVAYENNGTGTYVLPAGWERSDSYRDDRSGLFVATFKHAGQARIDIAFRGTELNTREDLENNLFDKTQVAPAVKFTRQIIRNNPGYLITVTGHSLGGALALEVSHTLNSLAAVAFNPSPRIGHARSKIPYYRVIFRERDEPLEPVRGDPLALQDWGLRYNVLLDIVPGIWGYRLLTQHSIDPMTLGMLSIAATWSDSAKALLTQTCQRFVQ